MVAFAAILVLYHPVLWAAARFGGAEPHRRVLVSMCRSILRALSLFTGARFTVKGAERIPDDRPFILVANHQSMYDIPLLITARPDRPLVFVAKRELARGIPSISLSLRVMKGALIDRAGDHTAALRAVGSAGEHAQRDSGGVCIFPEGTRARDGRLKRFKPAGTSALVRSMPSAVVLPVAVSRSWELLRYGFLPVPFGVSVTAEILDPLEPGEPGRDVTAAAARAIEASLAGDSS